MKVIITKIAYILFILFICNFTLTLVHECTHSQIAKYHGYNDTRIEIKDFGFSGITTYKVYDYGSENYLNNDKNQNLVDIIGYPLETGIMMILTIQLLILFKN